MSVRGSVARGAALLGVGQALGQGLSFIRNVIVARLISPDDFGIAATFAITVSLLEMLSDLAADKLLIQARDGDDERLQATAQLWQVTRGALSAGLIAALAWPMSALFHVPHARWAFYWLALVPLLRGFVHLDLKRLQRRMRFGPQVLTEVGSQALLTAAAWPLAHWSRNYAAVLWLVIVQAAVLALLSHALAERRYRWCFDRAQARRLWGFGWPLLLNGLLMFGIFQGDRLLIGAAYSMLDLGLYSAALTLALAPSMLLGGMVTSLMLPLLSVAQDDPPQFRRRYALCVDTLGLLAGLLAIAFACLGPLLLSGLLGAQYAAGGAYLTLLGLAQSARLLRVGPTLAALALGDSQNSMWSNVWRLSGVVAAALLALRHAALLFVPLAALAGELLALGYSVVRLARRHGLAPRVSVSPAFGAGLVAVVPLLLAAWGWAPRGWTGSLSLTIICAAAGIALVAATSSALRAELRVARAQLWRLMLRPTAS
jgi:O-antigen/teichoic acid export membrane protein